MRSIWIFGIMLNWIACIFAGPVEVVYSGDGCECPSRLNYQVNVPKLPMPPKYNPSNYGYKIDVPPIQAKAKVSYTFDFSVEEPKPSCPPAAEKLNLLAKVDRIALHKPDCPYYYAPPAPTAPAPCPCGVTKPHYRYVNGKIVQPCRCQRPKCKCNLRYPNSIIKIENPILVASDSLERQKNNVRRKRDLERIFFRPRRQDLLRSARYVKLYHKPISTEKDNKENWLNMDLFADANPFKRKTKKVFFPNFRSRIVKREIKGEYDLLEKERQQMDLTIPEIIQFMPETLQPDFKRGPCQFGCRRKFSQIDNTPNDSEEISDNQEQLINNESNISDDTGKETSTTSSTPSTTDDDELNDDMHDNSNSFTKRNVNGYHYSTAVPPIPYSYMASQQNDYTAQNPTRNPTNPQDVSLCEQRKLYAAMRRASEQSAPQHIYDRKRQRYVDDNGQLGLLISSSRAVPDPLRPDASPLHYTGDLEIDYNSQRLQDPILGAPNYPVQHVSSEVLDRIISDIIYRHPDFIDASSHYGGALVDPEPQQVEQTMDFIKKLIDGRLGLFFDDPHDSYVNYSPVPTFQSYVLDPYMFSRPLPLAVPAIY